MGSAPDFHSQGWAPSLRGVNETLSSEIGDEGLKVKEGTLLGLVLWLLPWYQEAPVESGRQGEPSWLFGSSWSHG